LVGQLGLIFKVVELLDQPFTGCKQIVQPEPEASFRGTVRASYDIVVNGNKAWTLACEQLSRSHRANVMLSVQQMPRQVGSPAGLHVLGRSWVAEIKIDGNAFQVAAYFATELPFEQVD
jgi:hypothetical protein